jgi:hypothetical protein
VSDIQCYCEPAGCDEYCEVWVKTYHVARKEYRCVECQDAIKPGERYQKIFSIFQGDIGIFKTCAFCAAEWERVLKLPHHPDHVPGDLACHVLLEIRDAA